MPKRSIGYLEVIAGPMYCGKTEEMIRLVKRAQIGKKKVQVFKHKIDERYGKDNNLHSHAGIKFKCEVVSNAGEILKKLKPKTEIVAIDEAQWFGKELMSVVIKLLSKKLYIIVSGLATTFEREPFPPIPELMAISDRVNKLSAICTLCGADAIFHKRVVKTDDTDPLLADPKFVSARAYQARCRKCFGKK